MLIFTRRDCSL